jgi:hypothetical protein
MDRVALYAQLLDDIKVALAHSICKHDAGPKDVSHVGDGREPNELRIFKEPQVHKLHAFRFS